MMTDLTLHVAQGPGCWCLVLLVGLDGGQSPPFKPEMSCRAAAQRPQPAYACCLSAGGPLKIDEELDRSGLSSVVVNGRGATLRVFRDYGVSGTMVPESSVGRKNNYEIKQANQINALAHSCTCATLCSVFYSAFQYCTSCEHELTF